MQQQVVVNLICGTPPVVPVTLQIFLYAVPYFLMLATSHTALSGTPSQSCPHDVTDFVLHFVCVSKICLPFPYSSFEREWVPPKFLAHRAERNESTVLHVSSHLTVGTSRMAICNLEAPNIQPSLPLSWSPAASLQPKTGYLRTRNWPVRAPVQ